MSSSASFPGRIQGAFSAVRKKSVPMHHMLALLLAASAAATIAAGVVGTFAEERGDKVETVKVVAQVQPHPLRGETCLSDADMREAVAEKRVIAPLAAIRAAREQLPRAEIQRASLCKHEQGLVYILTALQRDGHFVQVMVDAQSGQVQGK